MTYRGIVKNSVVVLPETAELPEGTEVRVEPVARGESFPSEGSTLVEQFREVIGTVPELPSDMAEHHDHYLWQARLRDGWKAWKEFSDAHPIHAGGRRYSRDELHERP